LIYYQITKARNKVQFHNGISLNAFFQQYGTEDQCFDALYLWRWPDGFHYPRCGHNRCCQLPNHKLQPCNRCHHQTLITAGTIFESTKLPLTVWFFATYLMAQGKKGISAMQLHRQLGIFYNAAWRMKHKLMQVVLERDQEQKLSGFIFKESGENHRL
jgi:transposase-like protein